MMFEPIILC